MAIISAATATARAQMAIEATEEALVVQEAVAEAAVAETVAAEEARLLALAAIAIPAEVPTALPTATSEPTAQPVAAPTEAPTAMPEPTIAPTALPEPTVAATATAEPAATTEAFSAEISTNYNLLSIRRGPGVDYSRIASAKAGEPLTAVGQNATGNWIQICCIEGEGGWMATEFVTTDVALDALPIALAPEIIVNNSSERVPLYAGPFYNFDVVETIPFNSTLVVTGRNDNGQWYKVCCTVDGESGWVYSGSVLIDGAPELIPEIADDE